MIFPCSPTLKKSDHLSCGLVVCKYTSVNIYDCWTINERLYYTTLLFDHKMLLDICLTYSQKVWIAVVSAGFWIYFRTSECYLLIPRRHILPVIFVMLWAYLNYLEPLFLPIGLLILVSYSTKPKSYAN